MSRTFNDPVNLSGLVQKYEDEIGADPGYVSNSPVRLKRFVSATRSAWDTYIYFATKASGKWQFDDRNHAKNPIIKMDLVAGQKNYTFTEDEEGALILDVMKVAILPSATATEYQEITPADQQSGEVSGLLAESTAQGVPSVYDKTANGFFLDPAPSYSVANGLKVYINREPLYFTHTDTDKMPGCPGVHHDYFALKPAYEYARVNNRKNFAKLQTAIEEYEGDEDKGVIGSIERYFSRRSRDERTIIKPRRINYI